MPELPGAKFITASRTLNRAAPLRLYENAKKFGTWNPSEIDSIFIDYTLDQFTLRYQRLERARGATVAEIEQVALAGMAKDETLGQSS